MKRLLSLLLSAAAFTTVMGQDRTPAFPGAEGFGRYATGGRGGNVYYVTRNDDCTDNNLVEGTLRWALRTGDDTPRTILFKTSGTIYLNSVLKFAHPNVTIAGQTAPGGGICIAGYNIYVCKPNVILRHLRFRAGDLAAKSRTALDIENTRNVIIDHCSMTWSMEECMTMYDCDSTTVQWCIIGEGLYNSRNAKGARSYAMQWGGEHTSMHHTLITNCNNRMPRFNGVRSESKNRGDHDQFVDSEFFNNVIFNWGKSNSLYGGECYTAINEGNSYNRVYVRGNYFRPGPNTQKNVQKNRYFFQGDNSTQGTGQWLVEGNMFEKGNPYATTKNSCWTDATLDKVNADNWYGFTTNSADKAVNLGVGNNQANYDLYALTEQTVKSGLTAEPAVDAYTKVVGRNRSSEVYYCAGATRPRLDEVDTRLLAEAAGEIEPQFAGRDANGNLSRGMGIIDSPADVTLAEHDTFEALHETTGQGVGEVKTTTLWPYLGLREGDRLIEDTDGDGLPDVYERKKGLNPNDASDGAALTPEGYSNLEVFLNGVADGSIDKSEYETIESGMAKTKVGDVRTVSRTYYNIGGVETAAKSATGVSIVRENHADGTVSVRKVAGR
ncbi:MAG: Por secretion system protein [Prevotella sp.]|nr:Por secretion system protein [Prevotella sp.]